MALDVKGFATIGANRTFNTDSQILDANSTWSLRSESVFGIQLIQTIDYKNQLTAQFISRGRSYEPSTSSFEPDIDWLFLSHQITDQARFRLGILQLPTFLYSDTFSIGYSNPWVRPPVDFYAPPFLTVKDYTGADISWSIDMPRIDQSLDFLVFGGKNESHYRSSSNRGELLGTNINYKQSDMLFRYSLILIYTTQTNPSLNFLSDGYRALSSIDPIFQYLSDAFNSDNVLIQYHALSSKWEPGNWSFISEFNFLNAPKKDFLVDRKGWYFSASKRIQQWSPYGVVGYSKQTLNETLNDFTQQSLGVIPSGTNPLLDLLRAQTPALYDSINLSSFSGTLGIRYDLHKQAALKYEVQYFEATTEVSGQQTGQDSDGILNSLTLDLIF